MLRKKSVLVSLAVTAFWLVMVGLFLHRQGWFAPHTATVRATPPKFKAQDQWLGIFLNDQSQVGRLHVTSDRAEKAGVPGYAMTMEMRLETELFGTDAKLQITGKAWTAESGNTSDFVFTLNSGDYTMSVDGTVADQKLHATMRTGGEKIPLDFPVKFKLFPSGGFGVTPTGLPPLEPGESTFIDAFDPVTMQVAPAKIECTGRENLKIRGKTIEASVYTTTLNSITSKAWIGPNQEVLQATTPFGFTLRVIEPGERNIAPTKGHQGDLIQSLAIVPTGKPVARNATHLVVRVTGVDVTRIPEGPPWQHRKGDVVDIRQPSPLPDPDSGKTPPAPDFDTTPYLQGDAFVASKSPEIIARAKAIVGGETNPWKQSVLLYQWLFEHIEKVPVLSIPNALDTLHSRKGDCNEHAVLFAALARSLGIPCRIAVGIVYSDVLKGFGYHAWPEVYYGKWYPLDPTLGQLAPDATHIKLLTGNIDAWVRLIPFIGQIHLEVLTAQ